MITTNPLRGGTERRRDVFRRERAPPAGRSSRACPRTSPWCATSPSTGRARAAGKHAAFIGIQGGNALDRDPAALDLIPDDLVVRITLVHLTIVAARRHQRAARARRGEGLTERGKDYVRRLNEKRILRRPRAHQPRGLLRRDRGARPHRCRFLVTHTGVAGVHRHWRNLDDEQLRAVADSGGTIGVMYHVDASSATRGRAAAAETIVRHLAHIVDTVGEDHASLGSDWDGAINPPRDMPTHPRAAAARRA